jgi:predicted small integral membrane protein
MTRRLGNGLVTAMALAMLALLAFLLLAAPRAGAGGIDFFAPMIKGGWMAWTLATALFFYIIACLLIVMTILAIRHPETPRIGALGIETTRGDRLFISLLGSAFIAIAWLAAFGTSIWGALIVCLIYAAAVFRWV